ncbi:hypothetical protein EJO70_07115 [Variovorax sp. 553]|nr:hypothetical protein EJO70_07115 [Variovorax sp. 553]RSZ46330.1 hypothetical protein EJO71_04195 [Variovorax sp. 679]
MPLRAVLPHFHSLTPRLRALRVASPTPSPGAMPAARQSRFRGISRSDGDEFMRSERWKNRR